MNNRIVYNNFLMGMNIISFLDISIPIHSFLVMKVQKIGAFVSGKCCGNYYLKTHINELAAQMIDGFVVEMLLS